MTREDQFEAQSYPEIPRACGEHFPKARSGCAVISHRRLLHINSANKICERRGRLAVPDGCHDSRAVYIYKAETLDPTSSTVMPVETAPRSSQDSESEVPVSDYVKNFQPSRQYEEYEEDSGCCVNCGRSSFVKFMDMLCLPFSFCNC